MHDKFISIDLPQQIFKIFREYLQFIERNEVKINEEEFTKTSMEIFAALNTTEKNIILEVDKLLLIEQSKSTTRLIN